MLHLRGPICHADVSDGVRSAMVGARDLEAAPHQVDGLPPGGAAVVVPNEHLQLGPTLKREDMIDVNG